MNVIWIATPYLLKMLQHYNMTSNVKKEVHTIFYRFKTLLIFALVFQILEGSKKFNL